MYNKVERIHLIGVGGIGVSAIAELLIRHGYSVSGSDLRQNETIKHLETIGLTFFKGHVASNIDGANLVVYSSAVSDDNPELKAAEASGIPTIRRAEMLAELMRLKYGIAVAGAHGKTTTTSMIAVVLMNAGLDPTIVVGGRMDNFGGTNARLGTGDFMVTEADESDGSFSKLSPSIAIVTNLDREHMTYYKTMRKVRDAFLSFINKVPFYGLAIYCGDDPNLRLLEKRITRRKISYGFKPHNNYHIKSYQVEDGQSVSEVSINGKVETIRLQVPGRHNLLNAVAALAVADELSLRREDTLQALSQYQGVQRRFQHKGKKNGVLLIDDYAHHPTEIEATLKAAREHYPNAKIGVVFQPHRYSRTEDLFNEFSMCFKEADEVRVTDIYAAGEPRSEQFESEILVENIQQKSAKSASYVPSAKTGLNELIDKSQEGDIIFTFGAGDIVNVYQDIF